MSRRVGPERVGTTQREKEGESNLRGLVCDAQATRFAHRECTNSFAELNVLNVESTQPNDVITDIIGVNLLPFLALAQFLQVPTWRLAHIIKKEDTEAFYRERSVMVRHMVT